MTLFQQLNLEQKMTIVLVTHEHDIANYAQRRVLFKDGLITADEKRSQYEEASQKGSTILGPDSKIGNPKSKIDLCG
jgi:ABC-type lipoprotein export system ATPase subunit